MFGKRPMFSDTENGTFLGIMTNYSYHNNNNNNKKYKTEMQRCNITNQNLLKNEME